MIDAEKLIQYLEHKFYESYYLTNYTCDGIYEGQVTGEMKAINNLIRKIKHDCALEEYEEARKGKEE